MYILVLFYLPVYKKRLSYFRNQFKTKNALVGRNAELFEEKINRGDSFTPDFVGPGKRVYL